MGKKLLSIIIPCYNEEKTVETIYVAITDTMDMLPQYDYEILFVNDGSKDNTLNKLTGLSEMDVHVKYYSFSRNFGKEAAIYAGLNNARGDYVVIMDADMQDPPALLPEWSFWKLLAYSLDGIVNFSNVPLMISSYLGILMTFISFVAIIFIIVRKLIFGDPVSGWPSLVCIITFVGGIQLFCMGIMGQYLSKTYMEVKKRPHYIIQKSNDEETEKNK